MDRCKQEEPLLQIISAEKDHQVACHLVDGATQETAGPNHDKEPLFVPFIGVAMFVRVHQSITEYNPDGSIKKSFTILDRRHIRASIPKNNLIRHRQMSSMWFTTLVELPLLETTLSADAQPTDPNAIFV